MRTFHRVVYSILLPLLFLAFLAFALRFTMTIDIATSTGAGTVDLEGIHQDVTTVVSVSIKDALWFRLTGLTFRSVTPTVVALDGSVTTGTIESAYQMGTLALALMPTLALGLVLLGSIFCGVGYGSKFLTVVGTLCLAGATVLSFLSNGFDSSVLYHIVQTSGDTTKDVLKFALPSFLNARNVLFVIDGISLINLIFVLSKKNPLRV